MSRLPPSASVANPTEGGKLHAPSAERNAAAIVALMRTVAPARGRALEIASGTGQHVCAMAAALPQMIWHPTEIAQDRITSINAHAAETGLPNVQPAAILDAAADGWADIHHPYDLIHMGNLLHLITQSAAHTVLREASAALTAGGVLVIYGPFMRDGTLTSPGDAQFHTELRAANPAIGYKDDRWIMDVLTACGLTPRVHQMPANNLVFTAHRELS